MQAAIECAATLLANAGARVDEVALPKEVIEAEPQFDVLTSWEGARALEREARDHLKTFNPWNRERVEFARSGAWPQRGQPWRICSTRLTCF